MTRLVVLLSLLPALAFAQPSEPPPPPPEPAPAEPAPPVEPAPTMDAPPIAPAPPPMPVATPAMTPALMPGEEAGRIKRGVTGEIGIGFGMLTAGGDSLRGLAGLNIGVGSFVSKNIALSVRLAGVTIFEDGLIYVGVLGPHLQAWLAPQVFVGGGIGIGYLAGCAGGGCESETATGFDARLGYAFSHDGHGTNVSVELTSIDFGGSYNLNSIGLLLGYQGF